MEGGNGTMKRLYLDIETTGLDPEVHAIWQLAAIVEIDGVVEERLNMYLRPHEGALISKGAVPPNFDARERFIKWLKEQPEAHIQQTKFRDMLRHYVDPYDKRDKFWLFGYNIQFDERFVRAWFQRCNDKYFGSYFWWPSIDVAMLAAHHIGKQRHALENFKLETVAELFNCKTDGEWHNAAVDCEWTRNIHQCIIKGKKNVRSKASA